MTDNIIKFEERPLRIDGVDHKLLWPQVDTSCFSIIAYDWAEFNPILMEHTPTRDVVIQAGGNCGMYPLLHSKQFQLVFTFEPDPINFYCLSHNCKSNRIVKFNTAVGAQPEMLTMGVVADYNVGMHKIGAGETAVFSMPIDSLQLATLSLLHLDVEGFELPALRGGIETIRRCRPTIAVEISEALEETQAFFEELNYKQVYSKISNSANFIFIPSERS